MLFLAYPGKEPASIRMLTGEVRQTSNQINETWGTTLNVATVVLDRTQDIRNLQI